MEEIFKYIAAQMPNLVGLAVLAFVLWRQNEKLLDVTLLRLKEVEKRLEELSLIVDEQHFEARVNRDN